MALPDVNSWDVGVNPTSTILNTNIRDLVNFIRNKPHAVLRRITSAQSISSGIATPVQFNNELVDTDGGHSNVTNPSRYVVQTSGVYWCTATIIFAGNATGKRDAWFKVNGATDYRHGWQTLTPGDAGSGADMCINVSSHLLLEQNDYVEVSVLQNSGSTLGVNVSNSDPRFEILWVGELASS